MCRKNNPLVIHRMTRIDFHSTVPLEKHNVNKKTRTKNEKVNWLHVKEIGMKKNKPHSIFLKNQFDSEQAIEVNNKKFTAGRQLQTENASVLYDLLNPL